MGGNLGYDVRFVLDATHTFDLPDPDGVVLADLLAQVTAANLHGEFATVIDTATALTRMTWARVAFASAGIFGDIAPATGATLAVDGGMSV